MKFIKKLNFLVEGIGSTINFNSTKIGFNIQKDDLFLNLIDNAYLMKQIKFFINEEIDRFNKIFPDNKKEVYNFQNTIDVILDKIFKLVRSNKFSNNKYYYDIIEDKLKNK